jgi:quercetin dioxygenase-like cupin family protein
VEDALNSPRSDDPGSIVASSTDVGGDIAAYEQDGWRLVELVGADDPVRAVLVRDGQRLTIARNAPHEGDSGDASPGAPDEVLVTHLDRTSQATAGRAGMRYHDLLPGRLGGRLIASLISIPEGGPVPDYVHHHAIDFQLIFCARGWVDVVYEDQGRPFRLAAGDGVLQPPHIRHRVLEASPGLEVIEFASPALHATFPDPAIDLPTDVVAPERDFSGQRFVHFVSDDATWTPAAFGEGAAESETGIAAAGAPADVRLLRLTHHLDERRADIAVRRPDRHLVAVCTGGEVDVQIGEGTEHFRYGSTAVLPPGTRVQLSCRSDASSFLLVEC